MMGWEEREKIGGGILEEVAYEHTLERRIRYEQTGQRQTGQRWVGRTVQAQRTTKAKAHKANDKVEKCKSPESMVNPHVH